MRLTAPTGRVWSFDNGTRYQVGLNLRPAGLGDFASLVAIVEDYKHLFLEDDTDISREGILQMIQAGEVIVVDHHGVAVGAFWISDIMPRTHISVHFLVLPRYIRRSFCYKIFEKFITRAFAFYGVAKIKARSLETQTMAAKLLRRFGFFHVGRQVNETRVKGELRDVDIWELHREHWVKRTAKPEGLVNEREEANQQQAEVPEQ